MMTCCECLEEDLRNSADTVVRVCASKGFLASGVLVSSLLWWGSIWLSHNLWIHPQDSLRFYHWYFLQSKRATSDFPTFTDLNRTIWNLTEKNSYTSWNSMKRYPEAIKQAKHKSRAGFTASLVEFSFEIPSTQSCARGTPNSEWFISTVSRLTYYRITWCTCFRTFHMW